MSNKYLIYFLLLTVIPVRISYNKKYEKKFYVKISEIENKNSFRILAIERIKKVFYE
nr:hypothetical protein [uncultured Cetobacterium sp.]